MTAHSYYWIVGTGQVGYSRIWGQEIFPTEIDDLTLSFTLLVGPPITVRVSWVITKFWTPMDPVELFSISLKYTINAVSRILSLGRDPEVVRDSSGYYHADITIPAESKIDIQLDVEVTGLNSRRAVDTFSWRSNFPEEHS